MRDWRHKMAIFSSEHNHYIYSKIHFLIFQFCAECYVLVSVSYIIFIYLSYYFCVLICMDYVKFYQLYTSVDRTLKRKEYSLSHKRKLKNCQNLYLNREFISPWTHFHLLYLFEVLNNMFMNLLGQFDT